MTKKERERMVNKEKEKGIKERERERVVKNDR